MGEICILKELKLRDAEDIRDPVRASMIGDENESSSEEDEENKSN